jgi:phosphotransferase system enzyme I (PtsI)
MFLTQIRAALRASAYGKLQIMFPMVENMDDIYKAKAFVKKAMEELDAEGIAYDKNILLGVVMETPSLAMIADLVAAEVDFASIGSNDLVQYCCVADRTNHAVADYYQSYSPAMVRFYAHILDAFQRKGKRIAICGEIVGNPKGALLMVGLGARWISMDVNGIASVKAALSNVTLQELKKSAEICKNLRTEQEVMAFLGF